MKKLLLLLSLTACQDIKTANTDWQSVCPAITPSMTQYQKFQLFQEHSIDGKRLAFTGVIKDVRYDFMDDMPVVLLQNPDYIVWDIWGAYWTRQGLTLDEVWGRLPVKMREQGLEFKKGEWLKIEGVGLGECMEMGGTIHENGTVYIDLALDNWQGVRK